jgi:hypothetical protein
VAAEIEDAALRKACKSNLLTTATSKFNEMKHKAVKAKKNLDKTFIVVKKCGDIEIPPFQFNLKALVDKSKNSTFTLIDSVTKMANLTGSADGNTPIKVR